MKNLIKASLNLAPIVLFVYNRPECTLKTLEHLKRNVLADQSELFIYSDGPKPDAKENDLKKIQEVREIIRKEKWCKEVRIIESPVNLGLADSIINGVTEIVCSYNKVIVLEDDLLTSVHFLEYMNNGLNYYVNEEKVFQIVGYTAPLKVQFRNTALFLPFTSTLGWGTWARAWKYFEKNPPDYVELKINRKLRNEFNLNHTFPWAEFLISQVDANVDSWGIYWWWSVFKQKGLTLFPDKTLISHIGFDQDATHTKNVIVDFNKYWDTKNEINIFPTKIVADSHFFHKYRKNLRERAGWSVKIKIKNKIKKYFKSY
jgi:hypothetical protein